MNQTEAFIQLIFTSLFRVGNGNGESYVFLDTGSRLDIYKAFIQPPGLMHKTMQQFFVTPEVVQLT